jgi:hypothetical protein
MDGGEEEAKKWPVTLADPDDPNNNIPAEKYEEAKNNWDFALKNFALLLVDPVDIDMVDLASLPNRRILYTKKPSQTNMWQKEELVP